MADETVLDILRERTSAITALYATRILVAYTKEVKKYQEALGAWTDAATQWRANSQLNGEIAEKWRERVASNFETGSDRLLDKEILNVTNEEWAQALEARPTFLTVNGVNYSVCYEEDSVGSTYARIGLGLNKNIWSVYDDCDPCAFADLAVYVEHNAFKGNRDEARILLHAIQVAQVAAAAWVGPDAENDKKNWAVLANKLAKVLEPDAPKK